MEHFTEMVGAAPTAVRLPMVSALKQQKRRLKILFCYPKFEVLS